jgi:hypothetical protein
LQKCIGSVVPLEGDGLAYCPVIVRKIRAATNSKRMDGHILRVTHHKMMAMAMTLRTPDIGFVGSIGRAKK